MSKTEKKKKSATCRVTPKEKRLLTLLRIWEISPEEVVKALGLSMPEGGLEAVLTEEKGDECKRKEVE